MPELSSPVFWVAVLQIIAIDIILSGDNAVVIALACRNLPPKQRRLGILWGVFGAVSLRIILTAFAAGLLAYPYLKLIGGALLVWIGIKLLLPEDDGEHETGIQAASHLWGAVKIIIMADFIMSLDNVIAVAAASRGSIFLLIFGLAVSIPLIIWTSQIFLKLMERFPVIVTLGAGLLGYVAGGMMVSDAAVKDWIDNLFAGAHYVAGAAGTVVVVVAGRWLAARKTAVERRVL